MRHPTEDHLPLKPVDLGVLLILSHGAQHGYGIVKRLTEEAVGGIRLAPSNLYHVLDRMVAAGLVEETRPTEPEDDAVRRRYFGITPLGRAVVAAEAKRLEGPVRTAARLRLLAGGEA
jgi:DNA-binding PadR family transcriptional regulator